MQHVEGRIFHRDSALSYKKFKRLDEKLVAVRLNQCFVF